MNSPAITIYLAHWCPYCQRALELLREKKLAFTVIDVDQDPALRAEMVARSGRRTVPQIFFGERHLGGCDDLMAFDRSGEFDRLIQGDR
ncbi:MAG: glutaredoxin 3 [Gammaproteobacteria bacterium]|nr:glutaredoxin 3 [Gammaproteobacteria bacterium]